MAIRKLPQHLHMSSEKSMCHPLDQQRGGSLFPPRGTGRESFFSTPSHALSTETFKRTYKMAAGVNSEDVFAKFLGEVMTIQLVFS